MKYIFYFSLLVFALSSCKSNSLMKQRYTHYSNKPAKKESNKPFNNHQNEKMAVVFKAHNCFEATENAASKETGSNTVSDSPLYASSETAAGITSRKVARLPINEVKTKSHEGFILKKMGSQLKTNFQKKTDMNRGPISALLRLVLSIVFFVVLVVLIVILILLLL